MLKFRRTKSSQVSSVRSTDTDTMPKFGGRMKKSAPPPPPPLSTGSLKVAQNSAPPVVPVVAHNPDDSAINELLEGRMDLQVVLPGDKIVNMMVPRRMPMMDLLVLVTSANKINPSGHVIQVITDRGNDYLHYKPSTPIGSLDANQIHVLPKNTVIPPPVKKLPKVVNQPFEQTFRLQVNLPRNQLAVLRVSQRNTLADIHRMSCEEKALEPSKYDLRHPSHLDDPLDSTLTLSQYGLNEISLVPKRNLSFHGSTNDIITFRPKDEEKKKKGIFGFQWKRRSKASLDSQGEDPNSRGASPTRSDSSGGGGYTSSDARSTSPSTRPLSYHEGITVSSRPERPERPLRPLHSKKRPAPPPPPAPSTSNESSEPKEIPSPVPQKLSSSSAPIVSHSRHSSDSSGYHEASVLSDALDSMPTTQSSSPTTSIDPERSCHNELHTISSESIHHRTTKNLKSSISCPNVSVVSNKKRKAPPPPPIPGGAPEMEDIDAELQAMAKEQIEVHSKLRDGYSSPEKFVEALDGEEDVTLNLSYEKFVGDGFTNSNTETTILKSSEKSVSVSETFKSSSAVVHTTSDTNEVQIDKVVEETSHSKNSVSISKELLSSVGDGITNNTVNSQIETDENVILVSDTYQSSAVAENLTKPGVVHIEKSGNFVRSSKNSTFVNDKSVSQTQTTDESSFNEKAFRFSGDGFTNPVVENVGKTSDTINRASAILSRSRSLDERPLPSRRRVRAMRRQTTINAPIMEDNDDLRDLQDAYSSKLEATIKKLSERTPPVKPKRMLSARHRLQRVDSTNMPVAYEEPSLSVRRLSITSQETISEIEASYEQTIAEAEKIIGIDETSSLHSSETKETDETLVEEERYESKSLKVDSPRDKPIFQEESIIQPSSVVTLLTPPPTTEITNESIDEVSLSNNNTSSVNVTDCSEITESFKKSTDDKNVDYSSASSVSSFDSQIRVTTPEKFDSKPKLSKASFRISTYSSEDESYIKVSEKSRTLSTKFSSMQDLSQKHDSGEEPSVQVQDDVESTMRKVQSEVNLMVAQHDSQSSQEKDDEELQEHYKKLQDQFLTWQKRLMDNEVLLDKAETLPRTAKKPEPEEKAVKMSEPTRPTRRGPSIKIGTWSDQKNDLQYKTEIKIQSEELDETKNLPTNVETDNKPKFQISHSKIDTDIFSRKKIAEDVTDRKPKAPVVKPVIRTSNSFNKGGTFLPSSTWSKVDRPTSENMPIFKKRGVTTNNRGELVVKGDRADLRDFDVQNRAIQQAKNQVMEQVKNRVREVSLNNGLYNNINHNSVGVHQSSKPLLESNHGVGEPDVNVYIENKKNVYDGGKENLNVNNNNNSVMVENNNNNNVVPPPPPPPPTVPNNRNNECKNAVANGSVPVKRKPRKIFEPKLDAREELMLAIRNFGGRVALRKV